MTDPQRWHKAGAFEDLVAGSCPPPGELLLAVTAEFRDVEAAALSFRLDELSRPMFGLAVGCDPHEVSLGLATLLTDEERFRSDETSADGLLLDTVLQRRAGHPLALSVLAAEVGRRAGVAVGVYSTPTGWYAGIGDGGQLWLIDPSSDDRPTPTGPVRRHCGHELAFAALTGLYARFVRDCDEARARHAGRLRDRLPVGRHEPGV